MNILFNIIFSRGVNYSNTVNKIYVPIRLMNIATNINMFGTTVNIAINSKKAELCAVELLSDGNVIAIPTDTVYGLACSAININAINKLYLIKGRDQNKPLAICVGRIADIQQWAIVNHLPEGLLSALLPGSITLILPCTNIIINQSLTSFGKIGVRVPDYQFIRNVVNTFNYPIALTSANISGQANSIEIEEFRPLWNKVSAVFNGGKLGLSGSNCCNASTVVDLSNSGSYEIVRHGSAVNKISCTLERFGLLSLKS